MSKLILDFGRLKGWDFSDNEDLLPLLQEYAPPGPSFNPVTLERSPERLEALIALIDAVDGEIINNEGYAAMTKDEAKQYVRDWVEPETPYPTHTVMD